ncbi:VRR-NUC domain-containing protein [Aliivibrio salmonicida]|uniref:Uncharacterized protein n=1 Tax=Aliivibrio salmonicida (strain LFI1238) TaxID=316275 RepID=B6ELA5_ALISL|nr:nuclease [Aliivibrio salmonicida]AZL84789.1 VRR-NUC domain-containing protein [Aliivibrio salmonicida]CAQ79205.1 hypothetical protein VSAL_I1520 [Aliivibrio salmonicida LFI1238]
MIHTIKETVFTYPQRLQDDWAKGKKEWLPLDLFVPIETDEHSHPYFGEYFALSEYRKQGWLGTAFYALGNWEPNNPMYTEGRVLIAQYIDPNKLSLFKGLRTGLTSGEPDLFLYKPDSSLLFVVVKKENEYLSDAELICLSNIKSVLEYDVEIAYLAEEKNNYKPKSYDIKVVQFPNPLGV